LEQPILEEGLERLLFNIDENLDWAYPLLLKPRQISPLCDIRHQESLANFPSIYWLFEVVCMEDLDSTFRPAFQAWDKDFAIQTPTANSTTDLSERGCAGVRAVYSYIRTEFDLPTFIRVHRPFSGEFKSTCSGGEYHFGRLGLQQHHLLSNPCLGCVTQISSLILDKKFNGKIYLKGLLMDDPSLAKPFKYGYNFFYGEVNRDRQRFRNSNKEARMLCRIWVEAIRLEEATMLPHLVDMLQSDTLYADVDRMAENIPMARKSE